MKGRLRKRSLLAIVCLAGGAAASLFLWRETRTPPQVLWQAASLPGCTAEKAEGLVLQEETADGDVWATEGYSIYRSEHGGPFERVAQVRPRLGEAWGGYLRTLRRSFGYQELVEVVPLRPGIVLAFAGGSIYRLGLSRGEQEEVFRLRYFGRGRGRGVMSRIAVDDRGRVFFGEYTTERGGPHSVRIVRGSDDGRTWSTAYEFAPGEALHIHGVEWDPYTHALWVMTGDDDNESRIGFSLDGGETFEWIGERSQLFRACGLVFSRDSVVWATDAEANQLVRWSRATHQLTQLRSMPAQSLYSQSFDDGAGLVSQSAWDASVSIVDTNGALQAVARFTPTARPGQPFAGIRLARGSASSSPWIYLNPLRTKEEESAIYRIGRADAQKCLPPGLSPATLD